MCGIVGYYGPKQAEQVLVDGLAKLEYRGYDSAGIAILNDDMLRMMKSKGRLKDLEAKLENQHIPGNSGIGHTRWATHGEPSDRNSHPHLSNNGKVAVVHNGIIENYQELKTELAQNGYHFFSDTDTEVLPNLIQKYLESGNSFFEAVVNMINKCNGSFALGILCQDFPDQLIAVRKDSPLIIGIGENESFIASDVPAILKHTNKVVYLENLEIAVLSEKAPKFFDLSGNSIEKDVHEIDWTAEAAEKGGFEHFTLKEIYEQPQALRDTMSGRIQPKKPIRLDEIKLTKEDLEKIRNISIVACGTAYHAGLAGRYSIEKLTRIPVNVEVSSEFRYGDPILDERSIVIVISQSGETADTLAVVREAKQKGARLIAVTNVVGSSIAREVDDVIYTWAGPEIGVASTKAYLTQLVALYSLAIHFAELLGTQMLDELEEIKSGLLSLPERVEETLILKDQVREYAAAISESGNVFFLGRGLDNVTALEASLKLKELSYIHSEAYPGGEMKHGPIALIDQGTVVISPVTQSSLVDKMVSNLKEVQTRGARVMAVVQEEFKEQVLESAEQVLILPKTLDILTPVTAIVPLQLLAYYVALFKGFDVDKPRNLAKSVTVE